MFKKLIAASLLAFAIVGSASAASVRELMLNEIIDTATIAFEGTCTGNRTERDPLTNFVVTYTTFSVTDVLKGNVQATHTIKQLGGEMPGGELSFRVNGIPTFTAGEDYVVFLAGVSSAGFSSPIGLAQGKFSVLQTATGKTVSNGRTMRELTAQVPPESAPVEAASARRLGLDEIKSLARARVKVKQ